MQIFGQDLLTIAGWGAALIFVFLLFNNYKGANALAQTGTTGVVNVTKALQGR